MVNCNPETVSTDYDTSDRLYFEPLTSEDVLEIIMSNARVGICMASSCNSAGRPRSSLPTAGASGRPDTRHLARHRSIWPRTASGSTKLCDRLELPQPRAGSPQRRGGASRRRRGRLPGDGAPVVRARRASDADRVRCGRRAAGDGRARAHGIARSEAASPRKRPRSSTASWRTRSRSTSTRCRPHRRLIGGVMEHTEQAGVHSGDIVVRDPAAYALRGRNRRAGAADALARACARSGRTDECAIRDQGR